MGWGAQLAEGLRPAVDLVYPPRCPLCGEALARQGGLCIDCWTGLESPADPRCSSCDRPVYAQAPDGQCRKCRMSPPRHSGVHTAALYGDTARDLVLRFKRGRKLALARLLGQLMAANVPDRSDEGERPFLLVPVPLHRLRLWERGFNQSAMLGRELSRLGKGELCVDALVRQKYTPSLGGLGSTARQRALKGAIGARPSRRERIAGRDVLLVDDVLTSGATSNACVDALLEAGATSVRIACFARVID